MTAMINIKDEKGNEYTLDNLTDKDIYQLINMTRLASVVNLNKYTLAARVCRQYPDGDYKSLVTALQAGQPKK